MNARFLPSLGTCLLALAFCLGTAGSASAQASGPVAVSTAQTHAVPMPVASVPLFARWTDILNNRARMIQGAFIIILLGIFVLRR